MSRRSSLSALPTPGSPPGDLTALAALAWNAVESLDHAWVEATVAAAAESELATAPAALLHLARLAEQGLRLDLRSEALARLSTLLSEGSGDGYPELRGEVRAELAIDAARMVRLDEAEELAQGVLGSTGATAVARARATEALGRVFAWRGDEANSRQGEVLLRQVALEYARMGSREWEAHAIFWLGNAVFLQLGRLAAADTEMARALEVLPVDSRRRALMLTFHADVLIALGRWAELDRVLDEAATLAIRFGDPAPRAYVAWSRARAASVRGDAPATIRHVLEAERSPGDWLPTNTGTTFLADAAELLDRVGERNLADDYLARARARDPDDEFVRQAQAALLARRGDPEQALQALRELSHAPWLEARLIWRNTLLTAYASLRAGHDGVGDLTARALAQAEAAGGLRIAVVGEPALVAALAPTVRPGSDGSRLADELLAPDGGLAVRLVGEVRVSRGGEPIGLRPGIPGALFRLLALHPAGLDVEEVLDALWPDVDPETARQRLRHARSRLRVGSGDLLLREGSRLRLVPAWVDAVAFAAAADRALAAHSAQAPTLATAALAICAGQLLPGDPFEEWALRERERFTRRRLGLLDLLADDAARRGNLALAVSFLEAAIEEDAYDDARYLGAARHLLALGQPLAARRLASRAAVRLAQIDAPLPAELRRIMDVVA